MTLFWQIWACCITLLLTTVTANEVSVDGNTTLESPQVTSWGTWGQWEFCPSGSYVSGMQLKTEEYQGAFSDDSALNGIRLYCGPIGGITDYSKPITSSVGASGEYSRQFMCNGPATGFQLRSEKDLGWYNDDTAASNLRLYCDGKAVEGDGVSWGDWTAVQNCPAKSAICGIRTQVEGQSSDDTALNSLQVLCCPVLDPSKHCEPYDSWDLLLECDNSEAVSETSCTYERKIGTTHWNMVSESSSMLYELYSYVGFTIPGALASLPVNFEANLGQSLTTGYNWTSSSGEIWREETSVTVSITVPRGVKTELYQTYGKCDFYAVRANVFKRVDTNFRTNAKTVTFINV